MSVVVLDRPSSTGPPRTGGAGAPSSRGLDPRRSGTRVLFQCAVVSTRGGFDARWFRRAVVRRAVFRPRWLALWLRSAEGGGRRAECGGFGARVPTTFTCAQGARLRRARASAREYW